MPFGGAKATCPAGKKVLAGGAVTEEDTPIVESFPTGDQSVVSLEAVINGRYRETRSAGPVAREVLTMTFERPGAKDIIVKHFDMTAEEPDEPELEGERRFAPYSGSSPSR